jgi:hypothetical protein
MNIERISGECLFRYSVRNPMRVKLKQAIDASFVKGFRLVMLIAAGLALASALTAALLIEGKQPED